MAEAIFRYQKGYIVFYTNRMFRILAETRFTLKLYVELPSKSVLQAASFTLLFTVYCQCDTLPSVFA